MKRSEINQLILENRQFIEKMGYHLPPFAYWDIEQWKNIPDECTEVRDCQLGWDITDYDEGHFYQKGLFMVTLRNGCAGKNYLKPYAEKIMVAEEEQVTVLHFHWRKMEDIINRGGGNLMIQVYNSTEEEGLDLETPVTVCMDGSCSVVPAGTILRLEPGQSITIQPGLYHSFWGEKGHGKVLIGEVSMYNDDFNDNRFYEQLNRFQVIEEDVPAQFLLTNELV